MTDAAQENVPMPRPQRPATLVFTQAILALQAFAAIFSILLVWGLSRAEEVATPGWLLWGCGLAFVVLLGYAAGQQRKRWGRWLGWALQAPMLAAVLIEPAIAIMGLIFLGLWIMALRLGGRIDRERAERDARVEAAEQESGPAAGEPA